jgi:hypothetical protein
VELTLKRKNFNNQATLGELSVNGIPECVTLEDVVRNLGQDGKGKVFGATAIPEGRYKVIINMSPRLRKPMMRVLNVPFFDGVLIHSGNDDQDTMGCILVGQVIDGPDRIHGGSLALPTLKAKVQKALDAGEEVWITITNEFGQS